MPMTSVVLFSGIHVPDDGLAAHADDKEEQQGGEGIVQEAELLPDDGGRIHVHAEETLHQEKEEDGETDDDDGDQA